MKTSLLKLFLAVIFLLAGCSSARLLNKVKNPRNGRPIKSRLAITYSSNYQIKLLKLESLHPFDINKYSSIYRNLVTDGLIEPEDIYVPEKISDKDLSLVHTYRYLSSLTSARKVAAYLEAPYLIVLPSKLLRRGVLNPFQYASGGTLLSARQALNLGVGINLGGGFHHARPDKGEGFCIYADIPVAIKVLQKEKLISKALIIDLDVHQGNGTAVCFQDDESVFTFSMHQGNIYPFFKEKSDLDIELLPGTNNEKYLKILSSQLPGLFETAEPDIVFIVGGCDTLEGDPLASLNMTESGIVARDWMAIKACLDRNIPVVMTLAGGYSKDAWHAQYLSIKNIIEQL